MKKQFLGLCHFSFRAGVIFSRFSAEDEHKQKLIFARPQIPQSYDDVVTWRNSTFCISFFQNVIVIFENAWPT